MEIKVIFEDDDLLILDKSAGTVVNRSDTTKGEITLQDWVERYLKLPVVSSKKIETNNINYEEQAKIDFVNRAGIAHRLDKETSGIILVAKNYQSFRNLQLQFKERKVQKTYIALVHGEVIPESGEINVSVGRLPWNRRRFGVVADGRESVTEYKTLSVKSLVSMKNNEKLTLLELHPKSGRTHQIRVHLQYIKHPIFSDPLYAGRKTSKRDRELLPRIFLHAFEISFFHPKSGLLSKFESPLPQDLAVFLAKCN